MISVVLLIGGCAQKGSIFKQNMTFKPERYTINGEVMQCGNAETQLNPYFSDYAASKPGTIVINPVKVSPLPTHTQKFIYQHECAHQLYHANEADADCIAAKAGKSQGWLNESNINHMCDNILKDLPATRTHLSGRERCHHIRACYKNTHYSS